MPPVSRKDSSTSRRFMPTGRTAFASARRSAITGRASVTAGVPVLAASPSESTAGIAACENGPRRRTTLLMSGARAPRSDEHRRRLVGERAEPLHRRLELVQERRQRLDVVGRARPRRSAVALATSLELRIALATRARSRASGARIVSELTASCSSTRVLLGQDLEHLVGLAQRRVGAPDDLVEVRAAAREPGAELVEDQRQPLALGLAHRVADQVDVHRLRSCSRPAAAAGPRPGRPRSRPAPAAARRSPSAPASACTRRSARRSGSAGARCSSRRGGSPA